MQDKFEEKKNRITKNLTAQYFIRNGEKTVQDKAKFYIKPIM